MAKRPTLGRGLAALLGETADESTALNPEMLAGQDAATAADALSLQTAPSNGVVDLPVLSIRRNPRQPRRVFELDALNELATSIGSVGVVQPIIVRRVEGGYELIAGERRWRAAQLAGYTVIPAIVRNASDVESLELALVENVVRQQLNPVDEAYALKVLLEDLGVTQDNLAARVGRSRSAIANKIRLLDLPAEIQDSLAGGAITEGHGRALLGLSERGKQLQLARRIADKGLSVRQVEEEVRRLVKKPEEKPEPPAPEAMDSDTLDELTQLLYSTLGIMPRIKTKGPGGTIEFRFSDREHLFEVLNRLRS